MDNERANTMWIDRGKEEFAQKLTIVSPSLTQISFVFYYVNFIEKI